MALKTMKRILLNLYYWPVFFLLTVLFFLILPFFFIVYVIFLRRTVAATIRRGIVLYGWILVKLVPFFAPVGVEYQTQPEYPAIVVANHNSAIDPYLFGALLIDACFFSTWAFKIPCYGFCMRLAKYIDANEGWDQVCRKSTAILQSGTSLIIWPEGHRSRDGRLGRFKNGAFALAVETGFPLLPVCILGSGQFMPPGQLILSPHRIKLIMLDPIYPDRQNDPHQETIRLRHLSREAIQKKLQEEQNQSTR